MFSEKVRAAVVLFRSALRIHVERHSTSAAGTPYLPQVHEILAAEWGL